MLRLVFTTILLVSSSAWADLKEVAMDYAEALIKAHPEIDSVTRIRRDPDFFVRELKESYENILFLDGNRREQLKRRKQVVTDADFKKAIHALRTVVAQDPEGNFLLKQITTTKLSPQQRLFFYRYMRHLSSEFQLHAPAGGTTSLEQVYAAYLKKKEALGRTPSFEELELPPAIAAFKDPESGKRLAWIYVADAVKLDYKDPTPVFAIPVPRFTASGKIAYAKANAICADGSPTSRLGYKKLMGFNTNTQPVPEYIEGKIEPYYLEILTESAKIILARHKLREEALAKGVLKASPPSHDIRLLKLNKQQISYPSADGSTQYLWIYLGAGDPVLSNKKKIICMTSTPAKDPLHLGFFSDGSSTEISAEQFKTITEPEN